MEERNGKGEWDERAGPKLGSLMVKAYAVEYVFKMRFSLWNYHFQVSRTGMHSGRSASLEKKASANTEPAPARQ